MAVPEMAVPEMAAGWWAEQRLADFQRAVEEERW